MKIKPKVCITQFPIRNRGYFEWIYTGLQILEAEGRIDLQHEGSREDRWLRRHPRVYGKMLQHTPGLANLLSPVDQFSMLGRVEYAGRSSLFAYDVTDSPFTFALAHLEMVDVYFKTQCPIHFDPEGYPLSSEVRVPYHPDVLSFRTQIVPAMSTGPITNTLNLDRNLKALARNASYVSETKNMRIFASFGGDKGPPAWNREDFVTAPHNYMNERTIMRRYPEIQHPNEKRAQMVRILRNMRKPDVDARIWNTKDPEIQGNVLEWSDYLRAVGCSIWNINVAGFRRSLPFRFLDSFQVGCGIATDSIGTKWYREFERDVEVVEFGELGYETAENTRWDLIRSRMESIYESTRLDRPNSREIRQLFEEKWHPKRLAEYFLKTCEDRLDR